MSRTESITTITMRYYQSTALSDFWVRLVGLEQDVGADNPRRNSVCKPATTHQLSQRYGRKIMIKGILDISKVIK
jgi:hypothetical protein